MPAPDGLRRPQGWKCTVIEESSDLKKILFRSLWAVVPAVLLPLNAMGQASPESRGPAGQNPPSFKYEAYAGFGYTSLNQVNQSRYGLVGANLMLTRDFGRYFGLTALANYYKPSLGGSSTNGNPGDPSIYEFLAGPEIHATIYGPLSGFFHGGLGLEHTGGEGETPTVSFAGGFGGGLTYDLNERLAIRAYGDRIGASFTVNNNQTNNSQQPPQGYSPHTTFNSSGTIGIVFRF